MNKGILYLILFMTFLSSSEVAYNRNTISKESPASHATKIFTDDEFQFQIKSKEITINLGSTREEVEQQLGLHVDYYYYTNVYEYKDMSIHYKDGIVDGIMIDDPAKFKKYYICHGEKINKAITMSYRHLIMQYWKEDLRT